MKRYLLRFCKTGNTRFLSHLDLQRLFKRAMRRAGIEPAFSNGYNPHELINIVQPLSLGYESDSEYFEIDTIKEYDAEKLPALLNMSMPDGIRFTACKETERNSNNSSNRTVSAAYEAVLGLRADVFPSDISSFLDQERILITKKDKKSKLPVEKDIKHFIYATEPRARDGGEAALYMMLRCASNETLNPGRLLESMFKYYNIDKPVYECRIRRLDIFTGSPQEGFVSLYESI
ncbi:MAG: TIGR03936 family radical SAM-associated protein [Firmicutes bacterium]|nr:TIGR03936 family radical SAM-associated protein [Bacillota bacterium]